MMNRNSIYLESTDVPAERTVGEIVSLLVKAKAREITQEYNGDQRIEGVKFSLQVAPGVLRIFKLPARSEPVFRILKQRRSGPLNEREKEKLREKAERVAWRQLYRWCQAQLAMIECGMLEAAEIFLPHAVNVDGVSVYQLFVADAQKQLPAKSSE